MPEFTIKTNAFRQALRTALHFASNDDLVPMINVVHFEPVGSEQLVEVVATDRFTMSMETLTVAGEPFAVSIPRDIAERLLAPQKYLPDSLTAITREDTGDGRSRVTARIANDICAVGPAYDTALSFIEPSHGFVNYRDLLAKEEAMAQEPAQVMGFDPELLGRVCAALTERGDRTNPTRVTFRGARNSMLIELGDLRVIFMPVRLEDAEPPTSGKRIVEFAEITTI